MLLVETVRPVAYPVEVQCDEYIPLAIRTSAEPLAVAYHTLGDGVTSLVEIKIERTSRLIRAFALVSFRGLSELHEPANLQCLQGLPVIASADVPESRSHADAVVRVGLWEDTLGIDWSEGEAVDTAIEHGRVVFLVGQGQIRGAVVRGLAPLEVSRIRGHADRD